jgi:hypothetical protein
MKRGVIWCFTFWGTLSIATGAQAVCPTFHTLTNGTPADATQVMDNFNYILQCPGFAGPVGVGTSTPNFAGYPPGNSVLSIYGTSQPAAVLELVSGASVVDGYLVGDIAFENTNLSTASKRFAVIRGSVKGTSGSNLGGQLDFITKRDGGDFAYALTIANSGNVGIGTTSPSSLLYLRGAAPSDSVQLTIENTGSGGQARFLVANATRSYYVGVANSVGDSFFIYDGTAAATRFIVSSGGNVGIGQTTPARALDVNGTIRQSNCTTAGTLSTNTSGDIICTSDARLKNIIGEYRSGLDVLAPIKPKLFTYKPTHSDPIETFVHAGFIAQNVRKTLPQATALQHSGYYSLDTTAILAAAVNAIKELKAINEQQAAEIRTLRQSQMHLNRDVQMRLRSLERRSNIQTAQN